MSTSKLSQRDSATVTAERTVNSGEGIRVCL